jgi:hypothetical protein
VSSQQLCIDPIPALDAIAHVGIVDALTATALDHLGGNEVGCVAGEQGADYIERGEFSQRKATLPS